MFNVYGERQGLNNPYQGVMGIFIGHVLRGETINIFGDGEQTRDFLHIDDVVNAWMTAWHDEKSYGEVFNVGCGGQISMLKLIDEIALASGYEGQYPLNFGPVRSGDQRHMSADISHIRTTLEWTPQVELNDGIRRTIDWAREEVVSG